MPDSWKAEGHTAKILMFDEKTILLPLNEREVYRLLNMSKQHFQILKGTNDFPEELEYHNMIENLASAHFLLVSQQTKLKRR